MKIKMIDELDVGISNVEVEGEITYTTKPKNVKGEKEGKSYDFWSQFIVISDDTGKIGCNLTFGEEKESLGKGDSAKIKGTIEEYKNKDGNIVKTLRGKVVKIMEEEGKKETSIGGNGDYWNAKYQLDLERIKIDKERNEKNNLYIARECAIKAVTELVKTKTMKSKDYFSFAEKIVNYIYNGNIEEKKEEKSVKVEKKPEEEPNFVPATTKQKNKIFGYQDEKGWHKGMIESQFITDEEIEKIGEPDKLSKEKASEWLSWWWGKDDELGERDKREIAKKEEETPLRKHLKSSKEEPLTEKNDIEKTGYLIKTRGRFNDLPQKS